MASNAKNLAELLNTDSTVAVGDIADGSVSTAKLADDAVTNAKIGANAVGTTEIADDAVTSAKSDGSLGIGKNVIINGAMQVAQRGTSSTGLGAANGYFTCDRYRHVFNGTAGRITSSQSSDAPAGFGKSLKFECTTADTSIAAGEYFFFSQKIEGQNLQHFAKGTSSAKAFAVSFYVKGNAAATYALELYDADNNRQCSKSFNVTTSWNRVELIFPADTTGAFTNDNGESLVLSWWLHAGTTFTSGTLNSSAFASNTNANRALSTTSFFDSTNRTFFITGIKLEPVQVTDYVHRSFDEELRLCERYFYMTYPHGDTIGAASGNSYLGRFLDGAHSYGSIQVPHVNMRTAPTRVIYNTATGTQGSLRSDTNNHNAAITGTAAKGGGWIYANGSSIGTSVSVKAHLTMDAEL